jgi:hypothetical protein
LWFVLTFMKHWRVSLLIFELALFAVILILPQVDLPEFTFQDGTAPVTAHARVCQSAPGAAIMVLHSFPAVRVHSEIPDTVSPLALHSRLSQLCVLLC